MYAATPPPLGGGWGEVSNIKQHFTQRGMNMNNIMNISEGGTAVHQCRNLLNKVGSMCAHDMAAKNVALG